MSDQAISQLMYLEELQQDSKSINIMLKGLDGQYNEILNNSEFTETEQIRILSINIFFRECIHFAQQHLEFFGQKKGHANAWGRPSPHYPDMPRCNAISILFGFGVGLVAATTGCLAGPLMCVVGVAAGTAGAVYAGSWYEGEYCEERVVFPPFPPNTPPPSTPYASTPYGSYPIPSVSSLREYANGMNRHP